MWSRERTSGGGDSRQRAPHPTTEPTRESDRLDTLASRRLALWGVPIVAAAWLVAIVVWPDVAIVVRVATIASIVAAAGLAARAAATTVRFRRRWARDLGAAAPPVWVTLVLVGSAVGATVAWSNVIADASDGLLDLSPVIAAAVFSAAVGVAGWFHLTGMRGLTAELHRTSD